MICSRPHFFLCCHCEENSEVLQSSSSFPSTTCFHQVYSVRLLVFFPQPGGHQRLPPKQQVGTRREGTAETWEGLEAAAGAPPRGGDQWCDPRQQAGTATARTAPQHRNSAPIKPSLSLDVCFCKYSMYAWKKCLHINLRLWLFLGGEGWI